MEAFPPTGVLPRADPELAQQLLSRFGDDQVDHTKGTLKLSIHSWLVQTPSRTILIDTATGNRKSRPSASFLNQLNGPYLELLDANMVSRHDVTDVLVTHVHPDHVGWNTLLHDGKWQPTFPNARYYFSERELDYNSAVARGDSASVARLSESAGLGAPLHFPDGDVFEDSVLPIIEAGLATKIEVGGAEPIPGFRYIGTPGHSIDHASIMFEDGGENAFFWGDVMHHPLQLADLSWNSRFCEFPDGAPTSRRKALDLAADTGALVFTTHFPGTSVGRVLREDDQYVWRAVDAQKP